MKIFLDTEFTGLHQKTTLISLAMITETGLKFYAEFLDYDVRQIDGWIQENVLKHLYHLNKRKKIKSDSLLYSVIGKTEYVFEHMVKWLQQFNSDKIEIWSDCLAYDWVLFCELFGGAISLPDYIDYIPYDICTLFKIKGIDPDISREKFVESKKTNKHCSLDDAIIIKQCYEKLIR